ncbi:hypothetical protein HU200_031126 [Digitaria exilis]|uniref:Late embryogenesis abundant protein LEA-2 subgroup domain-containing protein n=1 Tax=Digitaria exilis TaxID=1010633 RepID=A0A835BQ74_9POAL|nr:hypothetical protein HU200_031126 [Digitaria exilis]
MGDDSCDDIGGCHGVCCLCCICGAKAICNLYAFIAAVILTAVLVAAFAFPLPVHATVTDASLSLLDLIAGGSVHNHNNGGGGGHHYSLAYNLSLAIVLTNPNWAMRAELTSPLDAELRFAGRRFDGARLAGAGRRVPPDTAEEFAVVAVSSPRGVGARGRGGEGVRQGELRGGVRARAQARREGHVPPREPWPEQEDGADVPGEDAHGAGAGERSAEDALDGVRQGRRVCLIT